MENIKRELTDVIELVSHETRTRTVVALAARQCETPHDPTLQFSELRERVGHDDPGNFNYHLQRLTDGLVKKTDGGYRLSDIGHELVGTLLSGRLDPDVELELSTTEVSCLVCGKPAIVSYAAGMLRVECEKEHLLRANIGPEVLVDRSVKEALDLAVLSSQFDVQLALEGLCSICNGQMSSRLRATENNEFSVIFEATCERCGELLLSTVGSCILDSPAVVLLCSDHDLTTSTDARTILTEHVESPELLSEDPFRTKVGVSINGDRVVLVLNKAAEVVSVTRGPPG